MIQIGKETKLLAFVIPTKNRSKELRQCLKQIAKQGVGPLRVIVVASGDRVDSITDQFSSALNIEYIHSNEHGQILQRNIGIGKLLQEGYEYIGFLDDDGWLCENSVVNVLEFIKDRKHKGESVIGVGLNIVNGSEPYYGRRYSWIKKMLLQIGDAPGVVTRAGNNTSIENVRENISTEWLGGGYTIWSGKILKEYPQTPVPTRFAVAEDLRYSYPIGRLYGLYVCAAAKVVHAGVRSSDPKEIYFRSRKQATALLYFCSCEKSLSGGLFVISGLLFHLGLIFTGDRRNNVFKIMGFVRGVTYYCFNRRKGIGVLADG
jgi:glycosyltransferase involved in cell wall biosynthesis